MSSNVARDTGVRRVILASSAAVYGSSPDLPKREDMMPEPKSPYAVSKLAGEHYARVFEELYGLEIDGGLEALQRLRPLLLMSRFIFTLPRAISP
jgi:GDP-D-mannose dehydratase